MKPTPVAPPPRRPKAEPARVIDEGKLGLPQEHDRHPLLEAATLAGTAGGAAIGAIAGPVGVIAGGAIGAAIGMLGGTVLDEEDARTSHHDAELDDAIGVTAGPLGAKEAARRGLAKGDADAEDGLGEHVIEASSLLRREHARLEIIYGALLDAYRSDDWNEVRAQWRMFEPALVAHMDLEERRILPFFREVDPKTADELVGEHRELRRLLEIFGVNLELHAVNARTAEALVMRLRRHGEREEDVLYPWVDRARHLDLGHPETPS